MSSRGSAILFSPGVYRAYGATAIVVAYFLGGRHHGDWAGIDVMMAVAGDFLIVGLLAAAHGMVARYSDPASPIARWNSRFHGAMALLLLLLVGLAQALFLKTGDVLNLDILSFVVRRSHELVHVASGAVDHELVQVFLVCIGLPLLASLRFSHRVLTSIQWSLLAIPVALVPAGSLLATDHQDGTIVLPAHLEDKRLYQGHYQNMAGQQQEWNRPALAGWRKGILMGMSVGSVVGATEYQALARDALAVARYQAPHAPVLDARPPNVLFLLLESVRHDMVGAYGGSPADGPSLTPFIDELAAGGWRVDRAYTTIPHTSKALVGIYCGTFPRFGTDVSEAVPGNLPLACLPRLLAQAGYRSAHFQTAVGTFEDRVPFLGNVGFDDVFTQESFAEENWVKLGYLGVDDRAMVGPAVEWMRQQARQGRPFFASMLTIATHHPYVSPGNIQPIQNPEQAKAAYMKGVRYTDEVVRELFSEMARHGLLDNTLVVVTGDHGEAFAEHGAIAHNGIGYEEGIRVPLILSGPMLGSPRVVEGLRQHIDLMPTVLDVAGIRWSGRLPGKSLKSETGHGEIITSCFYSNYCLSHVAADGRKVVYFHGKRSLEMYDLNQDPLERSNLFGEATEAEAFRRLSAAVSLKKSYELVYAGDRSR